MVLAGDHHHLPQTRNGALNMEVLSDLPASPWIAAGNHRGSRAPTSFVPPPFLKFKPDVWDPTISLSALSVETLSGSAFGQSTFSLGAGIVSAEAFLFL